MPQNTIQYNPDDEESARLSWYLANRDRFVAGLALNLLRHQSTMPLQILDAGCGTGGVLAQLHRRLGMRAQLYGCDMSQESLLWGKRMGRVANGCSADVCALPFPDRQFSLVICSEVLEHVEDDEAALRELMRVSHGPLLLTVPAHPYLWSDSDNALLHKRRYTRKDLLRLLSSVKPATVKIGAFGMLPGIAVAAYNCLNRRQVAETSSHTPLASRYHYSPLVNAVLSALFAAELHCASASLICWGHAWWAILRAQGES